MSAKPLYRSPFMHTVPMIDLILDVRACHACVLRDTCTIPVAGDGNHTADVMFIGEGPGAEEDNQGVPFSGPSGQMLRRLADSASIIDPYYTNVVKCRPPGNRDPTNEEIKTCRRFLNEEIHLVQPKVIVAVGRYAMNQFMPDESITKARGKPRVVHGRVVLPIMHTAAALRRPELETQIAADLRLVPRLLQTPLESSQGFTLSTL